MRLLAAAASPPPAPAGVAHLRVPLKLMPDDIIPLLDGVQVNGQALTVSLDTGSGLTLEAFPAAQRRLGLAAQSTPDATMDEVVGIRGPVRVAHVELESLALGPLELKRPRITLTERNAAAMQHRDGNLGNGFLQHGVLTLDYVQQTVSLWQAGPAPSGQPGVRQEGETRR